MLIGIAGRKGHGKDTVANILVADGFTLLRFAEPLKAMLRAYYRQHCVDLQTIERKIEGDLKELPCHHLRGKTPRHAMQTLGTEWGRGCMAGDLWVRSLIDRYYVGGKPVVVPDVRFANECHAIQDVGGKVIRVEAHDRVPANDHSTHESEQGIDTLPVDLTIDNNGSGFALRRAVEAALTTLGVAA